MKSILAAALLLTASVASAAEYKFAPPGNAVCAMFEGSFTPGDQTSPEESISGRAACSGQPDAISCRITVAGETGPNVFRGEVGSKEGITFVEAYSRANGQRATLRLMNCKPNGRCVVLQMFYPATQVGMMCVDPSMVR